MLLGVATFAHAEDSAAPTVPAVDHYVHLRFLPKASELAQDAKRNNLTILRIDELADRVIVSYKYPDGHTATLGYVLLGSNVASAPAPAATASTGSVNASTARYTVAERDPEVVYVSRPTTRVYYTDPYYSPYYNAWAPFTVGFGVGWATNYYYGGHRHYYPRYHHHGGHYRSGYHGGHRSHHGGHGGHGRGHR